MRASRRLDPLGPADLARDPLRDVEQQRLLPDRVGAPQHVFEHLQLEDTVALQLLAAEMERAAVGHELRQQHLFRRRDDDRPRDQIARAQPVAVAQREHRGEQQPQRDR